MRMASLGLFLATIFFGSPLGAQNPQAAQPEQEIVIHGEARKAIEHFVDLLTEVGPNDQIARWTREICPEVIGIDPTQAEFMRQRIGEVARPLRLRLGKSGCTSTFAVIVTSDAAGTVAEFIRRYPITLRTDGVSRLKAFATSKDAVRWISVTDECGAAPMGVCVLPGTRLNKATEPAFRALLVVVDAKQIDGFSLGELSDLIALVGLSNPPPLASDRDDTILSMFRRPRQAGAAFELTNRDHSFLAALYHAPINASSSSQRSAITSEMRRKAERDRKNTEGKK
jgi:hypothetical protein